MADCIHGIEHDWCANCRPRPQAWGPKRWADLVFGFIPAPGEAPVNKDRLADLAGLTEDQVAAAVAYLRENYPDFPLVSDRNGYRFSVEPADIAKFRRWRVRTAQTAMRRSWRGVMLPYLQQAADEAQTRMVTRQFERLLEDIEELAIA